VIKGPTKLHSKEITIPDLRAGFAYVMAALIADGESIIRNLYYLDRGYETIDIKLASLGANVSRHTESSKATELLSELLPAKQLA
jgi:UDP-N-acetylglucosamine 1-carboxyvinyltransferase